MSEIYKDRSIIPLSDLKDPARAESRTIKNPSPKFYMDPSSKGRMDEETERIRKDEIIAEDIVNKTIIGNGFIIHPK